MATNEIIAGGYFTSTGASVNIPLRSDIDFFEVINYTQMATTANPGVVVRSQWQRGLAAGYAFQETKTNSTSVLNGTVATSGGFTLVNTSVQTLGAALTTTTISNATHPEVACSATSGVIAGDTYRLTNSTGALNLSGMDYTIGTVVANTSFELAYMVAAGAATASTFKKVSTDPMFYPTRRTITAVTKGTTTQVQFSVTCGYVVGQRLQFLVPVEYGMVELNGLVGTILSINTTTNTVTVDIDSSSFTSFAFPLVASYPFTFAQATPDGEIPTISTAATVNNAILGINLGSAVCGALNDVMYWRASAAFQYTSGSIPV
ncbi:MAG: hypothetical protein ACYC0F_18440 [Rhodanobacter sp.]